MLKLLKVQAGRLSASGRIPKTIYLKPTIPPAPFGGALLRAAPFETSAPTTARFPGQVEFVEVLGRDSGWIVAATALARHDPDDAPHLVYFPDALDQLLEDVQTPCTSASGRCVVAVCEGQ